MVSEATVLVKGLEVGGAIYRHERPSFQRVLRRLSVVLRAWRRGSGVHADTQMRVNRAASGWNGQGECYMRTAKERKVIAEVEEMACIDPCSPRANCRARYTGPCQVKA